MDGKESEKPMFSCPRPAETPQVRNTYSKRACAQPTYEQHASGHSKALRERYTQRMDELGFLLEKRRHRTGSKTLTYF